MLTYSKAIEKVMIENGGFASLKFIYKNIEKYRTKTGLTPDNTIQERVQRDEIFTRIGLGVYALTHYLAKLPQENSAANPQEREHTKIQGMLLEIGNHKKYDTYTNDKKWVFENKTLGNLSTLEKVPNFTYPNIIKDSVRFADVIWFNDRGFPCRIFEVEHSTDFRDAFIKFGELQDFMTKFYSVSPENRRIKFNKEKNKNAFKAINKRLEFLTYEQIESDYQNTLRKTYL